MLAHATASYASFSMTQTTVSISTPAQRQDAPQGPGFDGLDADGDGGVTLEEFARAAEGVRFGGPGGEPPAGPGDRGAGFGYGPTPGGQGRTSEIQRELERALAAIEDAGRRSDDEPDYSLTPEAGETGDDAATLRGDLYDAVDVDPANYDDAVRDVFALADADDDGVMSREEFGRVRAALQAEEMLKQNERIQIEIRASIVEGYASAESATGGGLASFGYSATSLSLSITV